MRENNLQFDPQLSKLGPLDTSYTSLERVYIGHQHCRCLEIAHPSDKLLVSSRLRAFTESVYLDVAVEE